MQKKIYKRNILPAKISLSTVVLVSAHAHTMHIHVYVYVLVHVTAWFYPPEGQSGALPAKRKRGAAGNQGSGGPKLKQPKLLDCLFDDELSPIQMKGKTTCMSTAVHVHVLVY